MPRRTCATPPHRHAEAGWLDHVAGFRLPRGVGGKLHDTASVLRRAAALLREVDP